MSSDETTVAFETKLSRGGYTSIPNCVLDAPSLEPGPKVLYLQLSSYAWDTTKCWPGQEKLAEMIGVSERTVRSWLRRLEEVGLVNTGKRQGSNANLYLLTPERFADKQQGLGGETGSRLPHQPEAGFRTDRKQASDEEDEGKKKKEEDESISRLPGQTSLIPEPDPPPDPPAAPKRSRKKSSASSEVTTDVQAVWDHYEKRFKPSARTKLTPSRVRQIHKALAEYDADSLCLSIDGLWEWRKKKPGNTTLSAIFSTHPGGKPLGDQIAFFISQAKSGGKGGRSFPSADPAIISQRQLDVQRGHRFSEDESLVERAKESEAWLKEHGIATTRREDGYPVFAPIREGESA